jgi:hypothetical protein
MYNCYSTSLHIGDTNCRWYLNGTSYQWKTVWSKTDRSANDATLDIHLLYKHMEGNNLFRRDVNIFVNNLRISILAGYSPLTNDRKRCPVDPTTEVIIGRQCHHRTKMSPRSTMQRPVSFARKAILEPLLHEGGPWSIWWAFGKIFDTWDMAPKIHFRQVRWGW